MAWSTRIIVPLLAALLIVPMAVSAQASTDDPFSSPEEVQATLSEVEASPWITVHEVGESVEGRPLQVAVVTDPNGSVPVAERAVTVLLTQQHGNEPAGTPAALDVLREIAQGGPLRATLSNQVVVILPQANPDGAVAGTRGNAHDVDLNRDHIALEEPETRAMHRVLNRWAPDVALDHHEYGGIGTGNPNPVRAYDYDLTTLFPKHGNARAPSVWAAKSLMYDGIWPHVREDGYSVNEYGELTAAGRPVDQISGGPDPGILRNHLGLHHIAGLLIESRVDLHPNPFNDAERRISMHRSVMEATLHYVHDHADFLVAARNASHQESLDAPHTRYVEGERGGRLAEAYLPADHEDARELTEAMELHGLAPLVVDAEANVSLVTMRQPLQGHAAAMVHPESSRAIVDAQAAVLPEELATEALASASGDNPVEDVPGFASVAALLALAGVALRLQRKRA